MTELNRLLSDNLAIVLGATAAILVIVLIAVLVQSVRLRRATRAYGALVQGAEGGSLQHVLDQHIGQVRQVASTS